MKNDLTCHVVRDLLPSYVDGLTARETSEQVKDHLAVCEDCRGVYEDMTGKEPPKAEVQEVEYLKKVSSSRRRLQRAALLAGCFVIILGVFAVLLSRSYRQQAAQAAETIAVLKETEEDLLNQMELPQAHYNMDTRVLVVTGTDRYDELVFPPAAQKAITVDVQDDEFHLSAYIPLLRNEGEPIRTYLPAYIDRIEKSLDTIREHLREHAPKAYPAEQAGKMVEISIRDNNLYTYRNDTDRIFLNIGDFYWHLDELYMLALMDTDSVGWAQLGYAWYVGTCLNPYSEVTGIMGANEITPELPYYDLCVRAGIRLENVSCGDFRILYDSISRVCLDRGECRWGWGTAYESMPLSQTRLCSGSARTETENSSMSVFMAVSFVSWLNDAYSFENVSAFAFGQKNFEEAFGMDFATAFAAWKAWIVETYPLDE